MKSYFITQEGEHMKLDLREADKPTPKAGELLVQVKAASLNRGEFIAGHGLHKGAGGRPAGQEAAGIVAALGEGVTNFKVGDRVMGRSPGAYSEFSVIHSLEAIPVPESMSWEEAGATPLVFLVTYDMLVQQGKLKAGEWLLITGVTSGVGVASLLTAKAIGAKVIGTSGSQEKLDALKKFGLDVPVLTRGGGIYDAVMNATDKKGANLVVNNVGGTVFAECIRSMAYMGRLATVGYLDRTMKAELDIDALHANRLTLFGVSNKLRSTPQRAETVAGFTRDWLPLFASGKVKPVIDKVFPFEQLPAAQKHMESDAQTGKIVVTL
ncbi:MAG TPA: zinc-binding dehydrogenase [Burkholderiales bacterium]|jgi:NADPH:quinone reductase-like Zn-dependent oxidoreductase|nr:zinc-binding dehydrogenase [Burkholderiales bacterium]